MALDDMATKGYGKLKRKMPAPMRPSYISAVPRAKENYRKLFNMTTPAINYFNAMDTYAQEHYTPPDEWAEKWRTNWLDKMRQ